MDSKFNKKNISLIFEQLDWKISFGFECYGVKIGIRTDCARMKTVLTEMLPKVGQITEFEGGQTTVSLVVGGDKDFNGLYFNDEPALKFEKYQDILLEGLIDKFLIILAISSLPKNFYLHAGAVLWNNQGIILPGASYSGKTTLVKEFIKAGAVYITDDLTVLSESGEILPFPRTLAIRTETGRELRTAEFFGARTLTDKIKLKMIIFTGFEEKAVWNPQILPPGQAVMKLLENFYYTPAIREEPAHIIKTLAEMTDGIKIYAGKRSDSESVIDWVSKFL